jgi:flavin reductase (DIM6/NTAB) family NADH-FMN oxidoreductase RutF
MHVQSEPSILYFGTPVALLSTKNENGTDNLAPMSSIFWLGWRCIVGLAAASKTTQNLMRTKECVINLPSVSQVGAVNLLAKSTGSNPVPVGKHQKGYRYHEDKFSLAGFTKQPSAIVDASGVAECPVQMEATVEAIHGVAENDEAARGKIVTFELLIKRVYLDDAILMDGHSNRVDPNKWKPLIMSFQQFYSLGNQVHSSTLAEIPEHLYNTPARDKAIDASTLSEME